MAARSPNPRGILHADSRGGESAACLRAPNILNLVANMAKRRRLWRSIHLPSETGTATSITSSHNYFFFMMLDDHLHPIR